MDNQIIEYQKPNVSIKAYRNDYYISIGDKEIALKRNEDFGMIKKKDGSNITQKPTLFKSGASKVLTAFGLTYVNEVVDSYKDHAKGYFYYEVKTTAFFNGVAVRTGLGCANTNEKSNGLGSSYDTANSMLKKASKRSEVDLAIKLADASGWFTQDLEDENNEKAVSTILNDDDAITPAQVKRLFAITSANGLTQQEAKSVIGSLGYTSTKDIKVKDYDDICEKIAQYKKGEVK